MINESGVKLYFIMLLKEFLLLEFSLLLIEELRKADRSELISNNLLHPAGPCFKVMSFVTLRNTF